MAGDIRMMVDTELSKRVGTWFTVRDIQDTLRINPATLKPLLMKYARENLLRRRHVKGTARSVQFTPAAPNKNSFSALITKNMPYRKFVIPPTGKLTAKKFAAKPMPMKKAATKAAPKKTAYKAAKKAAPKKAAAKKTTAKKRW